VERAFGATVAAIAGKDGEMRYRMARTATFPASVAQLVVGLVSLDGVLSAAAATEPIEVPEVAQVDAGSTAESPTPAAVQKLLHLDTTPAESQAGAGESIAIPARSNVRPEDFAAFRASFGLPELQLAIAPAGADPGRNGDEAAAMLAVSWAGVAAPGARIVLVPAESTNATDGVDLALAAAVDGALARTVSVGYSACEASLSPAHQAFYAALYRQAAAEGMAIVAASGDSGAAACHAPQDPSPVATGWGVDGLASTPWNTAVGAAAVDSTGAYEPWRPAGAASLAYATGGGASSVYGTPEWQSAAGLPASDPGTDAGHHRYVPDVSLPATIQSSLGESEQGLAFCFAGETGASGCRLVRAGGSAASAAIFSGIAAVLAQKYGAQGNPAPNLYVMSRNAADLGTSAPAAILDIASGNAKLPCALGTPG
jgi:subtilase family serine protease